MNRYRVETSLGDIFYVYADSLRKARNEAAQHLKEGEYIIDLTAA
ncbi:hypothetical protein [Burkholderia ubonensis]|nr:hypothetical protein [Burkholderia ubonensis]